MSAARLASTEGRTFEEVAPGEIEQELERQRLAEENGGSVVVRASVQNLVVVTTNRGAGNTGSIPAGAPCRLPRPRPPARR